MAASEKHRVEIEFDGGAVSGKLICPESCKPATTCWIKTWFDNVGVDELLHGNVTVEIDAEWDGETLVANIVPAPEQKSEVQR